MSQRKTQVFLVIPAQKEVGLTSIALGIVSALQRLGVRLASPNPSRRGSRTIPVISAARSSISTPPKPFRWMRLPNVSPPNQTSDLLEDIVALCMKASQNANILIVEGLHADATYNFTAQPNTNIANTLKAEIILVGNASTTRHCRPAPRRPATTREGGKVAGVILNMAPENFDYEAAKPRSATSHSGGRPGNPEPARPAHPRHCPPPECGNRFRWRNQHLPRPSRRCRRAFGTRTSFSPANPVP